MRRIPEQLSFWKIEDTRPIYSVQFARVVVGHFYEKLVAAISGGKHQYDTTPLFPDFEPDVILWGEGEDDLLFECKAGRREGYYKISTEQLVAYQEAFRTDNRFPVTNPDIYYAFCSYRKIGKMQTFKTVKDLYSALRRNTAGMVFVNLPLVADMREYCKMHNWNGEYPFFGLNTRWFSDFHLDGEECLLKRNLLAEGSYHKIHTVAKLENHIPIRITVLEKNGQ